jgi:hypothetical protein
VRELLGKALLYMASSFFGLLDITYVSAAPLCTFAFNFVLRQKERES